MAFGFVRKTNVGRLPSLPGVYCFKNREGRFLYIGKAANLQKRVKGHFQRPGFKESLWLRQVSRVGHIRTASEIEALLLESELIKKLQPKYNVMWKDDKNYFYVAVTKESLPRVFITHRPKRSNDKLSMVSFIGPFIDGSALKTTLKLLRRAFPYYTQKKHPLLKCSWCHLGLCPGPSPDKKEYRKNIAGLVRVLQGKKKLLLRRLGEEMAALAKSRRYEKAARLRDQIFALENIVANAKVFSGPMLAAKDKPDAEELAEKLTAFLDAPNKVVRAEAFDVSNIQGRQAAAAMAVFIDGQPAKKLYRKFKIKITGKPDDVAMLRETLSRRLRHPEWGWPDLILVDGGKAQLNTALQVAKTLHPDTLRPELIALAKRQERLYLPNRQKPVPASSLPRQLRNLFLALRDEAHRFAITYHRKLRHKANIA